MRWIPCAKWKDKIHGSHLKKKVSLLENHRKENIKMVERKFDKSEVWYTKCQHCCTSHIPSDYEICDSCLLSSLNLSGQFDSCDQIGLGPRLYEEEYVLRALRRLRGETYVRM